MCVSNLRSYSSYLFSYSIGLLTKSLGSEVRIPFGRTLFCHCPIEVEEDISYSDRSKWREQSEFMSVLMMNHLFLWIGITGDRICICKKLNLATNGWRLIVSRIGWWFYLRIISFEFRAGYYGLRLIRPFLFEFSQIRGPKSTRLSKLECEMRKG